MPVTIYPPITVTDIQPTVEPRGVAWTVGTMGTLDIVDTNRAVVATFAAQSWGWVEQS
jgi:hypothetical protein